MNEITKRKLLWDWTRRHIANGVPFELPSEEEITRLSIELKLPRSVADNNRALLQMFLADEAYCEKCSKCGYNSTCYLDGEQKAIFVVDGDISIGKRTCGKYARF